MIIVFIKKKKNEVPTL